MIRKNICNNGENLYKGLSVIERVNKIFSSGIIYSLIISLMGLSIFYDPRLFQDAIDSDLKIYLVSNYFCFVPSLALFVGIFVENKR